MVNDKLGKLLYGALFIIVIPSYFVWLTQHIQLSLPKVYAPYLGYGLIILGISILLTGFADLFFRGKGLPMNAFPPQKLVINGLYGLLPHPIYLGFISLVAGIALVMASAPLLWLIVPLIMLGCATLVWGYERPYLMQTFQNLPNPIFGPPQHDTLSHRAGAFCALFLPWLILFEGFKVAGTSQDAFVSMLPIEHNIPIYSWTYIVYASAYLFVMIPFIWAPPPQLKRLFTIGWISFVIVGLCYFMIPSIAPPRTDIAVDGSFLYQLILLEAKHAAPYNASLPSYHVIWSILIALTMQHSANRLAKLIWLWAIAIIISCWTTGMHTLMDIIIAIILAPIIYYSPEIWQRLIKKCNQLANSYHSTNIGHIRVMNHFKFSFGAGFTLISISSFLAGTHYAPMLTLLAIVSLICAILWGWLVEGANVSQRPLGYFGGILGFLIITFVLQLLGVATIALIASLLCAGAFAQAIGRFRCIIQGCCHGKTCQHPYSFQVINPRSRVVTLSLLYNMNIHPTQLYSIIGNTVLGLILLRLWLLRVDLSLIIGLYLVLTGFLRFIEEAYRGEIQTRKYYGLAIYQWLSILFIVLGTFVMTLTLGSTPSIQISSLSTILFWSLMAGLIGGFIGSVDFPNSNKAFSRLEK